MVRREDFDQILPEKEIKGLAQRKLLLVVSIVGIIALIIIIVLAALLGNCGKPATGQPATGKPATGQPTTGQSTTGQPATGQPTTDNPTTVTVTPEIRPPQPKEECRTPSCLHSAAWISDNIDTSVNPCENFYKFACGGWEKRNSIPPDEREVTIVKHLEGEIEGKLREIIEKIPPWRSRSSNSDSLAAAEGKLQLFFRSCVNDYGRMKASGRILVNQIKAALKDWYVLNPTNWSRDFDINEAIAATQTDFVNDVFFTTYALWDNGLNRYVLGVSAPHLRWSYMYNHPNSSAEIEYRNYIRVLGGLLVDDSNTTINSSEKETRVEQFVNDVYRMERDLYMMYYRRWRDGTYSIPNTTTVGQLQSIYPQISWRVILTRIFDGLGVNNETLIRVYDDLFFRQLNDLILNETQMHERDRIFNNYLVWSIVSRYVNALSCKYREANNNYWMTFYGYYERLPVWKSCINTIYNNLGTLLKYEFIKNHLSAEKKEEVQRMYMDIKQALSERLVQLNWIDDITERRVTDKLESVKSKIGFSDIYYNQTVMAQLHSSLNITRTASYLENLLSLNKFKRKRRIEIFLKTHEDPNLTEFVDEPMDTEWIRYWVVPYIERDRNTLHVLPGSLMEPLYNSKRPEMMNYGVLGTLVADQLLGSVDYIGRYYLKNGSYGSLWTESTNQNYRRIKRCFKRYFEDFEAGPFFVYGENITVPVNAEYSADQLITNLGGIRAAYNGYKKLMNATGGKDPVPVGLNLTSDQLFFVSSVQTKCYLRKDETSLRYARWGYIPEDMEINGLLSRMPEFSEAFSCPQGSKMKQNSSCETY